MDSTDKIRSIVLQSPPMTPMIQPLKPPIEEDRTPKMGRPRKYFTEEEKKAARKASIEKHYRAPFEERVDELHNRMDRIENLLTIMNHRIDSAYALIADIRDDDEE